MSIRDFSKCFFLSFLLFSVFDLTGQTYNLFNEVLLDSMLTIRPCNAINTASLESSPMFYKEGIVYVKGNFENEKQLKRGEVFFSLFYAKTDENGIPIGSVPFAIDENTDDHKGPVSFSADENTMYLSRTIESSDFSNRRRNKNDRVMQIYALTRGDTFWQDQQWLEFNAGENTNFHPSINSTNDFIIFSSDRDGGYGGFDLWGSIKIDGEWSEAFNLGKEVNSSSDEAFPYLYKDKYLFYSSNRAAGFGKFDFYLSEKVNESWKRARLLPEPFNSRRDDISIVLDKKGRKGFFASNRKVGLGADDIFHFSFSTDLLSNKRPRKAATLDLIVKNTRTKMRLQAVSAWFLPLNDEGVVMDRSAYKSVIIENTETQTRDLKLELKHPSELTDPDFVSDRNGVVNVLLAPDSRYQMILFKSGYEPIVQKVSLDELENMHSFEMKENICLPLEIKAIDEKNHRAEDFNLKVRARQANQFRQYSVRDFKDICLTHNIEYELIGYKKGYIADTFRLEPQTADVKKVSILFRLLKDKGVKERIKVSEKPKEKPKVENVDIKEGVTLVLDNIYYDFNKSSLQVGSYESLDALALLMEKYPDVKIQLSAHTDSRGNDLYNLRLSLGRAESAKTYLVNKGINANRIRAVGYGESVPRNNCTNGVKCTDEQHQYNRRTEVKILETGENVDIRLKINE